MKNKITINADGLGLSVKHFSSIGDRGCCVPSKITMSQKVANIFEKKTIERVLFHSGEVLELEDDTHAYLLEEIYKEAGRC